MSTDLAAKKWQDRRDAWESVAAATPDAAAVFTKETNGAVIDAALDAIARVADASLAEALLPAIIAKGLAANRGATGRRGLRAASARADEPSRPSSRAGSRPRRGWIFRGPPSSRVAAPPRGGYSEGRRRRGRVAAGCHVDVPRPGRRRSRGGWRRHR